MAHFQCLFFQGLADRKRGIGLKHRFLTLVPAGTRFLAEALPPSLQSSVRCSSFDANLSSSKSGSRCALVPRESVFGRIFDRQGWDLSHRKAQPTHQVLAKTAQPSKVGLIFALSWVMYDVSFGRICTPAAPGRQYSFLSSHGNLVPGLLLNAMPRVS
jgi:hypothetical protein